MARFIYLHGDTEQFECLFSDGLPTEVTDDRAIAKLRGNQNFREVEGNGHAEETRGSETTEAPRAEVLKRRGWPKGKPRKPWLYPPEETP